MLEWATFRAWSGSRLVPYGKCRIDVEAARGEHAGHMGQHAGDVLNGGGKDVAHWPGKLQKQVNPR